MAARNTPSAGSKPHKLMRDALMLELNDTMKVVVEGQTVTFKKLRLVARGMVHAAIKGDVPASREIFDRVDGKVPQKIAGEGKDGAILFENLNPADLTDAQLEQLAAVIASRLGAGGPSR
jgi:hypothetical protein